MEEIEDLKQRIAELEEQFQKQEKMASLGLLTAGIAHEVQNPLNFVINFSKLSCKLLSDLQEIMEDYSDKFDKEDAEDVEDITADLKENLAKISEHGERAISIIRGILLQSRGKAGEFLPVNIEQIVHEYIWLSYHAMRANDKTFNISIHEEYQPNMPMAMVIPQDFSRAILNVMNNACYAVKERATKEDEQYTPTINVKVALSEDKHLRIDISDNGIGMNDEVKAKLFENFFTTKPVGKGTGLGMGIIKDIITRNHNGELLVDSKLGTGTTITFIIPVKTMN